MAKRKVNKSQTVREYMAKHPKAGPSAVSEALAKSGVKVSPQQVSTIKANAKKAKGGAKRKATAARKTSAAGAVSVKDLVTAKEFADSVGGVKAARELLAAVEKISG